MIRLFLNEEIQHLMKGDTITTNQSDVAFAQHDETTSKYRDLALIRTDIFTSKWRDLAFAGGSTSISRTPVGGGAYMTSGKECALSLCTVLS